MTSLMSQKCFVSAFAARVRQGTYVLHFAASGEEALDQLSNGVQPELIVILSDINMPGGVRTKLAAGGSRIRTLGPTEDARRPWR
jgi:CheY-like chemotaxis protein